MVVDQEGRIYIRKKRGKLADVEEFLGFDSFDGLVGIAHTRWATHGEPSDRNAHPHIDCGGCISIVHNGTLQNYQELKEYLVSRGHLLRSDTDTLREVVRIIRVLRFNNNTVRASKIPALKDEACLLLTLKKVVDTWAPKTGKLSPIERIIITLI
jgi:glucosamine--fructose-6-phosphate aminotransferase (isomerizing)